MKKAFYAALLTMLFAGTMTVQAEMMDDENFSATVWFTSDYVFRGASFSDEDAAVQASFDWGYNNFYAGLWGSNLDLTGYDKTGDTNGTSSIEYDLYVGYYNSLGPIDYDFTLVYYWFPNDNGNLQADVFEIWLNLSHTFADSPLSPTVGLFTAYSPDATLEDGDYIYNKISLALVLTETAGVDFAVGFADIEGDKATDNGGAFCLTGTGALCDGYGYTHWEAGLTGEFKGFGLDLRYHDTNEQRSFAEFWGDNDPIDSRIVLTVSRSF